MNTHSFGDGHDHGPCPTCGHHWKPTPAVDGWVWCEHELLPSTPDSNGDCRPLDQWRHTCPGPHRTLHIGSEVDA